MNRALAFCCLSLALFVLPCAAQDTQAASQPASSQPDSSPMLIGPYGRMADTVKLTTDQQIKIRDILEESQKTTSQMLAEAQKIGRELSAAIGSKNQADIDRLQKSFVDIQAKLHKSYTDSEEKIREVMTPQQRQQWDAYQVRMIATVRIQKIQLSDDQKKQIDQIVDECGKELGQVKDRFDFQAISRIYTDAVTKVENVLTPDQKKQLPDSSTPPSHEK